MKNEFIIDKKGQTVTVTREFAAPQNMVWRAWTEAELLDQWWGPKPYNAVTKSMDFSVGGRRVYAMVSPEGHERWSIQEYTSINPKTNFKFYSTFADKDGNPDLPGSEWNVDLSEQNGITTVIVTIYNESPDRMQKMIEMGFKEGFTVCLEQLWKLLNQKKTTKPMNTTKVTIEATINATPEKTWDYWTKPEHIINWNFASDDWCCPSAENDLRVGGKYKARMEAKDGSFGFDFEAVYDEIIDLMKITYTMGDGRVAITNFENLGESTKVTTIFDTETENDVEMQRNGWQAILNNFKKYVEEN